MFKKKINLGKYVIIDFTQEAVEHSLGYDFLKLMYFFNNKNLFKIERYSEIKLNQLKKEGFIIYDKTVNQVIPKDSLFMPNTRITAGTLSIMRRLYG